MSHPNTRAERRAHRTRILANNALKSGYAGWLSMKCYCGYLAWGRNGKEPWCGIHNDRKRIRSLGKLAKTGPVNCSRISEPEWFLGGKVRRDYRAGGGRRAPKQGRLFTKMKPAGPFQLVQALQEWGKLDTGEYEMADFVEILHDMVGPYQKGRVVAKELLLDWEHLIHLGAVREVPDEQAIGAVQLEQPVTVMEQPAAPVAPEELPTEPGEAVVQVTKVELLPDEDSKKA